MNIEIKEKLLNGIIKFNNKEYYDSHEYFEDIWINYTLEDRFFIQALIQLSVAYFHISNQNKNGAIGLFKKCIKKLDIYKDSNSFIININQVIESAHRSFSYVQKIDNMSEFNWDLAPKLKVKDGFKC